MKIYYVIAEKVGSFAHGTNFGKGEYIPKAVEYFAKTAKGFVNLTREQVLKMLAEEGLTDVKHITERMLSLLRGKEI
ncbi:MAG: hypothetical protein HDR81_03070 [Bacteroides sp.]|nr:hypothetical protein [Bacteroides sp.]